MMDPEVARLRRLRREALRVREIAHAFGAADWAGQDVLLSRGACACWRLARVVSGKLRSHPYPRFQRGPGLIWLLQNRIVARFAALMRRDKTRALIAYASQLRSLIRQLDDARALTWSTDFSDTLGRSQTEIKSLIPAIELEMKGVPSGRIPLRAPLADSLVQELSPHLEGDWPYLAL